MVGVLPVGGTSPSARMVPDDGRVHALKMARRRASRHHPMRRRITRAVQVAQ